MVESKSNAPIIVHERYFPTSIFFVDLLDSASLNRELIGNIHAWKKEDPEKLRKQADKNWGQLKNKKTSYLN